MGVSEWGLILILSVIWGGSFFFVGVALKGGKLEMQMPTRGPTPLKKPDIRNPL